MASREVIDAWEAIVDECVELYDHVRATVADLGEIKTDLSGSTAKGAPPALPGGDKLAAIGPFAMDAPHDDFPHPLRFAYMWSWHCAEVNAALPPRRAWEPSVAYLRAHLHLIDGEHAADFTGDLQRVRGLLRRMCNWDRPSQVEVLADRWLRGEAAGERVRQYAEDMPDRYPLAYPHYPEHEVDKRRGPVMLTTEQAAIMWPELEADCLDDHLYNGPSKQRADELWKRIQGRKEYCVRLGDSFPDGQYAVEWIRDTLRMAKS